MILCCDLFAFQQLFVEILGLYHFRLDWDRTFHMVQKLFINVFLDSQHQRASIKIYLSRVRQMEVGVALALARV